MPQLKDAYTPGPWTSVNSESREARFVATVGYCGAVVFGPRTSHDGGYYDNHGSEEADARLCAAAPELLAALDRALKWLSASSSAVEAGVYADACAAIAKATGSES